jgi:hypothetical protein
MCQTVAVPSVPGRGIQMAEEITIDGELYKKRGPWAVWGLSIITIGIYGLVWYYKINDEARRYLRDESIRPGVSVLAIIPGALILVPPFVSIYRTGQRINRMEEKAGVQRLLEPIIGLIAALFYSLHMPYYQLHLNGVWDASVGLAALPPPAPGAPAIPPPPPPG